MAKRSHVISDEYLRKIVSGEMAEGQLLPTETALIEQYGVSRTAVREAIQSLAAKGFVSIRQGSGSTVAARSRWNILDPDYLAITGMGSGMFHDLVEARDLFEPGIAAYAAQRATPEDVARLRALVEQLKAVGDDPGAHADSDIAFHHALAETTRNPVLISIHGSLSHLSHAQRQALVTLEGASERAAFWHQHLLDAVAAGDAEAARDAMRMHLRQVAAEIETSLAEPSGNPRPPVDPAIALESQPADAGA